MRQKTTITYLEHNMLAYNRINRAIASWKKHVRVFRKTCTTFSKNTYVFRRKYNCLFKLFMFSDLYKNIIYVLIV